jgi:hypothetical protein
MKYLIQLFNFFFSNNNDPWEYGTVDGYKARRHRKIKTYSLFYGKQGKKDTKKIFGIILINHGG